MLTGWALLVIALCSQGTFCIHREAVYDNRADCETHRKQTSSDAVCVEMKGA